MTMMEIEMLERPTDTAIAEYSVTAAALSELRSRLAGVAYDVSTGRGLDIAKKDRAEVRTLRVALEAKRVELKAPALERSRLIDAEAKALTAELVALEKPIDDQIKAEEARKAVERAEREQAEREAAARTQIAIDHIRSIVLTAIGLRSSAIQSLVDNLQSVEITIDAFGDRAGEAAQAKTQAMVKLADMHAAALAAEAEAQRLEAERVELARLRVEQDARDKAERERVAAEQVAVAKKLADDRAAFDKLQAAAKVEQDRRDAEAKKARDTEDRLARESRAAEDKRIADARAALEADQRKAREERDVKVEAARKVTQDALDEAAAIERKRLDNEATARRAEVQRIADECLAEAERFEAAAAKESKRKLTLYAAAPAMLNALEVVRDAYDDCQRDGIATFPESARHVIGAAITLATGENE